MSRLEMSRRSSMSSRSSKQDKATSLKRTKKENSLARLSHRHQTAKSQQQNGQSSILTPASLQQSHLKKQQQLVYLKSQKKSVRNEEYQQLSSKKHNRKIKPKHGIIPSMLTQKKVQTLIKYQNSECKNKNKIKSACTYAQQAFNFSNQSITQPSTSSFDALPQQINEKPQKQQGSVFDGQQEGKQTSSICRQRDRRSRLAQRLKSLKNTRAMSQQKLPSLEQQLKPRNRLFRNSVSRPQVTAPSLSCDESKSIRLNARKRNKPLLLKLKNKTPEQTSYFLQLKSHSMNSFSVQKEVHQKIQLHLELLNMLPEYAKEFKLLYEQEETWEQLMFLVYKKFYMERCRVCKAVKGTRIDNPFIFPFCRITTRSLLVFQNSLQAIKIQTKIQQENRQIISALRSLYNHIIQKSGQLVNMNQVDNFSQVIYLMMAEQITLLQQGGDSMKDIRQDRIQKTIKCALMIAFLNGEDVQIDLILSDALPKSKQIQAFWQLINNTSL